MKHLHLSFISVILAAVFVASGANNEPKDLLTAMNYVDTEQLTELTGNDLTQELPEVLAPARFFKRLKRLILWPKRQMLCKQCAMMCASRKCVARCLAKCQWSFSYWFLKKKLNFKRLFNLFQLVSYKRLRQNGLTWPEFLAILGICVEFAEWRSEKCELLRVH